ncbi:hypothetical protein ABPG74_002305 [Tetrahymena malaccensis]
MYRAQPIFNKICVDKELERKREIHRQKINNIQSTFRQKTPQNYSVDYKLNRLKKEQQHESRYTEIERENRILLEKITHIMAKNTIQLNNRPGSPKSLNIQNRKRFVQKVQVDNFQFLRRLQDQKSNYSVRQWEQDFQKNQEMVSKISSYPLNLFQTPKDGSIMQHNQSFQQPYKTSNQGFININGNTNVNNSGNYSPERISYQNQQPQRPNTSQIRSSSNKYPMTSQNFYSQNNTIQQQSNQKSQKNSPPKQLNSKNNISSIQEDHFSEQQNYSNMLQMNNSSFERSQDYYKDRMPVIHSNPSSTKHSRINNGNGKNRNTTFYSGNIKSNGSREQLSRRNGRSKSNSQNCTQTKRKKSAVESNLNKSSNSISPDKYPAQHASSSYASSYLYPPNETTVILFRKPKKISGEFFQLEIRQQDNHLIILAEHVENQELKIIEIPYDEAQEFIREECDNDVNSLALRLRLHNGKLYLIGTKALQNANKKISTSPIQTSSDNQDYYNNQNQIMATQENQVDVNDEPQQSNMNKFSLQQSHNSQLLQQMQNEGSQVGSQLSNYRKENEFQPINNVQPNSIHDKHEEQPPIKLKM